MAKSKGKKSSSTSASKKINLDIAKIPQKNMMKVIKNLDMSPIYTLLIINLIVIAYISGVIHYLNQLQSCDCYKDKNSLNYSNLTYLIVIEAIILSLYVISTIMLIISIISIRSIKQSGSGKSNMMTYIIISLIINLAITIYFVYNVFKLSQNVDPECECTKSWLRYLLYIQAIIIAIGIFGNIAVLGRVIMS